MTDKISVVSASQSVGVPVQAKIVAEYILSLSNPDEGDLISHLKLQKLLYYCQGFHLAMHNTPLFNEQIYHWDHGPVVADLYHELKHFGSEALPIPSEADFSSLTAIQKETINEVYDVYGQFSAWKLRQMTHEEDPWLTTVDSEVITHEKMRNFFTQKLL